MQPGNSNEHAKIHLSKESQRIAKNTKKYKGTLYSLT